jgi:hypothetical protein
MKRQAPRTAAYRDRVADGDPKEFPSESILSTGCEFAHFMVYYLFNRTCQCILQRKILENRRKKSQNKGKPHWQ